MGEGKQQTNVPFLFSVNAGLYQINLFCGWIFFPAYPRLSILALTGLKCRLLFFL